MEIGPVQFIALGFPRDANFRGEIIAELNALRGRGLIRLIDLLFVVKDESGDLVSLKTSDLSEDDEAEFGAVVGGLIGFGYGGIEGAEKGAELGALAAVEGTFGLKTQDVERVTHGLKPGEAAALLLVEHRWAIRLRDAMRRAGGYPLTEGFLTPEVLVAMGASLRTMVGGYDMSDLYQQQQGSAHLETVQAKADKQIDEGDGKEGLEKVEARESALSTSAAVRTVRALIDAGIIDPSETTDAIAALAAANLVEPMPA